MSEQDRTPFDDFLEEFHNWEAGERGDDASDSEGGPTITARGTFRMVLMAASLSSGLLEEIIARYAPNVPPDRLTRDLLDWLALHSDLYLDEGVSEVFDEWTEADERGFQYILDFYTGLMESDIRKMMNQEI